MDLIHTKKTTTKKPKQKTKKQVRQQRGTMRSHWNSKRLLEDLTTNNYKDIVYEEFRLPFDFNFEVLVCAVGVNVFDD
jgi:hypothetical protein